MKKRNLTKFVFAVSTALLSQAALTGHALADWRADLGVFRIGIVTPFEEPIKPQQYEQFRAAMSSALEMPVEIFQARDASALIDAIASSRIEYAVSSSLGFATLTELCSCVTALAAPISETGAHSVRSVLYVDPNTIATLDDLRGKKIAIGPSTSLTGNIIPYAQFKVGRNSLNQIGADLVSTTDAETAMKLFMAGDVDAFFGWEAIGDDESLNHESLLGRKMAEFPQNGVARAWRSKPIRYGPHVIRNNLPEEIGKILREALLNLNNSAPLAYDAIAPDLAGGFKSARKADYATAVSLARSIIDSR